MATLRAAAAVVAVVLSKRKPQPERAALYHSLLLRETYSNIINKNTMSKATDLTLILLPFTEENGTQMFNSGQHIVRNSDASNALLSNTLL